VETILNNAEQEIVATDDRTIQVVGHNPKAPDLRVDLGNKKIAGTTDLLLFRFNGGTFEKVAKDDTLGVELYPATLVDSRVIYLDEFLSVSEDTAQDSVR